MATAFGQRAATHLRGAAPRLASHVQSSGTIAARQPAAYAAMQQRAGLWSVVPKTTLACSRRSVSLRAAASLVLLLSLFAPLPTRGAPFCPADSTPDQCRAALVETVKEKNAQNPVIVYSKTYCPYCSKVKALFKKLEVDAKIVELDEINEGDDVQAALFEISGRRTVPQVFVGGTCIGGADDTMALHSGGKLKDIFAGAGVTSTL